MQDEQVVAPEKAIEAGGPQREAMPAAMRHALRRQTPRRTFRHELAARVDRRGTVQHGDFVAGGDLRSGPAPEGKGHPRVAHRIRIVMNNAPHRGLGSGRLAIAADMEAGATAGHRG